MFVRVSKARLCVRGPSPALVVRIWHRHVGDEHPQCVAMLPVPLLALNLTHEQPVPAISGEVEYSIEDELSRADV